MGKKEVVKVLLFHCPSISFSTLCPLGLLFGLFKMKADEYSL